MMSFEVIIEKFEAIVFWFEVHQYFTTTFIVVALTTFLNKRTQININRDAERIKFEIQQKYLHTQIKTKNLLETYPQLYRLTHFAVGPIVSFFITLNNKIDRSISNKEKIIKKINDHYLIASIQIDLQDWTRFCNYFAQSALFISSDTKKLVNTLKNHTQELRLIIKNEISTGAYKKYTKSECYALITRANCIVDQLEIVKESLSDQMNAELNPY